MELRYDDETKTRLRQWRDGDRLLYAAAEAQLNKIRDFPHTHGIDGSPRVPRIVSFSVAGRNEQYVITWQVGADAVYIADVCSVTEMKQRARLLNGPPS